MLSIYKAGDMRRVWVGVPMYVCICICVCMAQCALALPMPSHVQYPSSNRRLLNSSSPTDQQCCSRLASIGFSSPVPVVILDSSGQTIPYHKDTDVKLCTCSPSGTTGATIKDYDGIAQAAIRGTSSANFTKKSFKVQLMDGTGSSNKFPFLGMPKDDDWILYGPELDATLGMRNYLTYNLARASGRYASRTVYCEVFLIEDGKPLSIEHYNGVYIAEEKVKRDKYRVDIAKLEPSDLSGGYIFLYDNDNILAEDVTFGPLPGWTNPFVLKDPNEAPDGGAWLVAYLTRLEESLRPGSNVNYTRYIDLPAWIDYFLLVELTKNPDGYRGSTYMHKDKGKPMSMGPAWDYNEAYGMCCGYPIDGWQREGQSGPGASGGSAISPQGWRFNICVDQGRCIVEPGDGTSRWFISLWKDDVFRRLASARWKQLREGAWSSFAITSLFTNTSALIAEPAARNYKKFADILKNSKWNDEVSTMQSWVVDRVTWMDGALGATTAPTQQDQQQAQVTLAG